MSERTMSASPLPTHKLLLPLLLVLCWLRAAWGAPSKEAVKQLPDLGGPLPSAQWSGFLDAGSGTALHYWLALKEEAGSHLNSTTAAANEAPLVLWLNGGPGSSSILGMLQEQGPLLIDAEGSLMRNPYSWTHLVNLLVVESPAGVGYSYCTVQGKPSTECSNTDISTAADARRALVSFFAKFPELMQNDFYIAGESYAGVYVPTLAQEVLDHAPTIKLRGVYVGDPCTDNAAQADSMDMLWYAHKYGLVPDSDFDLLWNTCGMRAPSEFARGEWSGESLDAPTLRPRRLLRRAAFATDESAPPSPPACVRAQRRFLASSSRAFSQSWPHAWLNDLTLYGMAAVATFDAPGSLNARTAAFMMRADVRKALHLEASPASSWPGPPPKWRYTSSYAACNAQAPPNTPSMVDFYRAIAPRLSRTLVFNGDTDPCVSYEGTRRAIASVGFGVRAGGEFRPWFFNATAATAQTLRDKPILFGPDLTLRDAGVQYGGSVVDYEHNLSFATVHGAGHMVPQFRPRVSLHMLSKLVTGAPLTPLWLPDDAMGNLSTSEFDAYLDRWTVEAGSPPFVPK